MIVMTDFIIYTYPGTFNFGEVLVLTTANAIFVHYPLDQHFNASNYTWSAGHTSFNV
jgi:hypothetical protein